MGTINVNAFVSSEGQVSSAALALKDTMIGYHTGADVYFTGYTTETPDTTTVCTTPEEIRTAVATWRSTPSQLLKCVCQWNGILDFTTAQLLGVHINDLTADAEEFGGWIRPAGGVWIVADSGFSPVIGNHQIDVQGFPRIHWDGIGFAGQITPSGSSSSSNLWFRSPTNYNLPTITVIKNCTFGLAIHRPAEPATEYTRSINATNCHTLHIEDCTFAGTLNQTVADALYIRAINNHAYLGTSDFLAVRGYGSRYIGYRGRVWLQGTVKHDSLDAVGFNGLHSDFLQYGFATDEHAGYDVLVFENLNFAEQTLSSDSGTQGIFYNTMDTPVQNNGCVFNNLLAYGAYAGIAIGDQTGTGDWYVERNTLARVGDWYNRTNPTIQDPFPRIAIGSAGNPPGTVGGTVYINKNIFSQLQNTGSGVYSGGLGTYVTPVANQVTGDGSTEANGYRYEDFFTATGATFARDGGDVLTYALEVGDTDKATAFYRIADFFVPKKGWTYAGCSNPETWTYAPARP